jgi:SNF2 family DNA or RNA helicase
MNRSDLHPYQNRAVEFIRAKKKCGLFLDMGLGKTVSALTAVSDLIQSCMIERVLVIAPLRVCNSVWSQEARKWDHLSHLKVNVATGPAWRRREALDTLADVWVINRENVVWLIKEYLKGAWRYDAVIIDESSAFKSPSAKRFKILRKATPLCQVVVLLTGTPSPNGIMDLWSQMYLIDSGESLGRTITSYRERFFAQDYMGYNWLPIDGSHGAVQKLIAPKVLSMQAEDYIDVPDRIDLIERVEMPADVKSDYDDFEQDLFLQFDGVEIEALSAGVLAGKLLQFANGAIYVDEDHNWKELHTAKLDALADIISENAGENVLCAYNFKHDLARLRKRFPDGVVLGTDPRTIESWNRGEIKLMLAHPGSCGHGINLQGGGSMIVFFSLNWNLEFDQQIIARLHRQGQTRPVRVVRILSAGTIDERVLRVLGAKGAVQRDLLKALRHTKG